MGCMLFVRREIIGRIWIVLVGRILGVFWGRRGCLRRVWGVLVRMLEVAFLYDGGNVLV